MVRIRFLVVFLALLGIVSGINTFAVSSLPFPGNQHLVVAFYKADYTWDTWDDTFSNIPAKPYVSSDVLTIMRHISEAKTADIDAFVLSWYGAKAELPSNANSLALLQQAEDCDFHVAVLIELNAGEFSSADDVTDALLLLSELHTQKPAYLRSGIKPVIFFRGQDVLSIPSWQAIRNRVDPGYTMLWIADDNDLTYLEVFDGVFGERSAMSLDPDSHNRVIASEIRAWEEIRGIALIWAAEVMPGYVGNRNGSPSLLRNRSQGTFYTSQWSAARESSADWIFINSYNDWKYATQIEPDPAYMDAYLTLTALQGNLFRSMLPEETPATIPIDILPTAEVSLQPTSTDDVEVKPTASLTPPVSVTMTFQPSPTSVWKPQPTAIHLSTPTPTLTASQDDRVDSFHTQSPQPLGFHTLVAPSPTLQRLPLESMPAQKKCFPFPLLFPAVVCLGINALVKRQE